MTFKVKVLQKFPCFPGFRNILKYIQLYGGIISEGRDKTGVEVIVACLRLLQDLAPGTESVCTNTKIRE
jgi:hypothetical protein